VYLSDALVENGKLVHPVVVESGWSSKELALKFINNGCTPIQDSKGQETTFVISNTGAIEVVKQRSDYQSHVISVLSGFGGTQKATAQLAEIGAFYNGYPKPVELIRYIVQMILGKDAVVLDFFAGSGPTAHAVMEQNAVDSGTRRYVLVQIPEPLDAKNENQKEAAQYCDKLGKPRNIAELTKERLRRAAKKIKDEAPMFAGDLGFRVFKLDSSNIRAWEPDREDLGTTLLDSVEHLKEGRTEADVLYELLLKRGLDLCVPIETRAMAGKDVHAVGGGVLMACLAEQIERGDVEPLALGIVEWHKAMAPAGDTTCVFRDSAFADDVAKTNLVAILGQYGFDPEKHIKSV
jgi:adenine-specific DNA-methyltransferase